MSIMMVYYKQLIMIRLLFVKEEGRAEEYGIGTYCKCFLDFFKEKTQFDLHVIILRSSEDYVKIITIENINYYYIPNTFSDNDKEEDKNIYYRNVWYLIYPFIIKDNISNYILHVNYWNHMNIIKLYKKYIPNGKVCFSLHYFDWCFELKGNISLYKKIIDSNNKYKTYKSILSKHNTERSYLTTVDAIIVLSKCTKEILLDIYKLNPINIHLIYNGLHKSNEIMYINKSAARNELGFTKYDNIILFVGRLDEIKGLNYLIRAFDLALNTKPNLKLIIVGNGNYDDYINLSPNNSDKIRFMGKIDTNLLYKLYIISDLGILPSFHEQCSYVIIEMFMHGLPVVVSDSTGLNEMVIEDINGYHIPINYIDKNASIDIKLLADKIVYIFNNPNLIRRLSHNSQRIFERRYVLNQMGENIENLYLNLCSQR